MIERNDNHKEEFLSKIYLGRTCTFVCPTNYNKSVKVLYDHAKDLWTIDKGMTCIKRWYQPHLLKLNNHSASTSTT
jgi:hypothetical protein